jgi:uncharacterized phage-associated protein
MKENEIKRVYKAAVIGNYFVEKGVENGAALTPMQINKLTSISHGFYLALTGEPLIGEPIEAWEYGPVVRTVYELFRPYGRTQVHACTFQCDIECRQFLALKEDQDAKHVLEGVWMGYGQLSGYQLSAISHEQGTPWSKVWHEQGGKKHRNTIIPDYLLRDYYAGQLRASIL